MKIDIIVGSGSPKSASLDIGKHLKSFFTENKEDIVNLYDLRDMNVHECLGCDYCLRHQGECIIHDDMDLLYKAFFDSDLLIIISPVYFSNMPGLLKNVVDRTQLFYNLKDKSKVKQKSLIAIHLGGQALYPDQFSAFKTTYRVMLGNINTKLKGFFEITKTDQIEATTHLEKLTQDVKKLLE